MARPYALVFFLLFACGEERVVLVEVELPPDARGSLCLTAFGAESLAFARPYPAAEARGTLTFIEGDQVRGVLKVAARLRSGGRVVARAAAESPFGPPSVSRTRLTVRQCATRGGPPAGAILGSASGARVIGVDVDGDGRDEIVASGVDGVRAIGDGGIRLLDERSEALVVGSGDFDGDCVDELIGSVGGRLALLRGSEGSVLLGREAVAVAMGDAGRGTRLAAASPSGLRWIAPDSVTRTLSEDAWGDVAIADLDGDGADDVFALGEDRLQLWRGGESGPLEGPAFEALGGRHLALGDLDGDGTTDVVVASGASVRTALGDGGTLVGTAEAQTGAAVIDVITVDVDGDCADEIVAVTSAGAELFRVGLDGSLGASEGLGPALAATRADLDGDAASELVLLRPGGDVERWAP